VLSRVDTFDETICKDLKEAGVGIIKFGVETGSLRIRKKILNRNIQDKAIIKAFKICKQYKIESWAFNMVGLPTETKKELYKTFELNGKIKPDNFWLSIYYPIEKTHLGDYCFANKLVDTAIFGNLKDYRTESPIISRYFKNGEIGLVYKVAAWILNYYAYPKHKEIFRKLIAKVFRLRKEGASQAEIENFITTQNTYLYGELIPPYYAQKFKHIALKINSRYSKQ